MLCVIAVYILVVYSRDLTGLLLNNDDLKTIEFVQGHNPFSGFMNTQENGLWFGHIYYRPIFVTQIWVYYHLFDLNYAGYRVLGLFQHMLGAFIAYYSLYRLTSSTRVSMLSTLLFASHLYVSVIFKWTSDTFPLCTIALCLVLILLSKPVNRPCWHISLIVLLVFASLTRENGLAITAAVVGYVFFVVFTSQITRRHAVWMLFDCLFAFFVYFFLRWLALGSMFPAEISFDNSGVFSTYYTRGQIGAFNSTQLMMFYAYNILANFISHFVVVLNSTGLLTWDYTLGLVSVIVLTPVLIVVGHYVTSRCQSSVPERRQRISGCSVGSLIRPKGRRQSWAAERRRRVSLAAGFIAASGILATIPLLSILLLKVDTAIPLTYSLPIHGALPSIHGALSLCIGFAVIYRSKWPHQHQAMAVFALGLIVASSVVAFPYFRFRSLGLGLIGWLLLLAMSLNNLDVDYQSIRSIAFLFMLLLIMINGMRLFVELPFFDRPSVPFKSHMSLCRNGISTDFAIRVAEYYQLDIDAVLACRRGP